MQRYNLNLELYDFEDVVEEKKNPEKEFTSLVGLISITLAKIKRTTDEKIYRGWQQYCNDTIVPVLGDFRQLKSLRSGTSNILLRIEKAKEFYKTLQSKLDLLEENPDFKKRNQEIKPYEEMILGLTRKIQDHLIDAGATPSEDQLEQLRDPMVALQIAYEMKDYPPEYLSLHIKTLLKELDDRKIETEKSTRDAARGIIDDAQKIITAGEVSRKVFLQSCYSQLASTQENTEGAREVKLENQTHVLKQYHALSDEVDLIWVKLSRCLPKSLYKKITTEMTGIKYLFRESDVLKGEIDLGHLKKLKKFNQQLKRFLIFIEKFYPLFKKKNKKIKPDQDQIVDLVSKIRGWQIDNKTTISSEWNDRLGKAVEEALTVLHSVCYGGILKKNPLPSINSLQALWKKIERCQRKCDELKKEILELKDESNITLAKLEVGASNVVPGFKQRLDDILHPQIPSNLEDMLGKLKELHNDLKEVLVAAEDEDPTFKKRNQEMADQESRILDLLKIIRAYPRNPLTKSDRREINAALKRVHQAFSNKENVDHHVALAGCIQDLEGIVNKQVYDGKTIKQWAGVARYLSTMFRPAPTAPMTAGVTSQPQSCRRTISSGPTLNNG